jgi:succinate-semialdehyde dehydrogenase/glutarate-semialdehyde dehydrogenase
LGGKTPFLILKDADLERAANCLCWNAFANTGHYCKSAERAYVQEEIFSELVEKVVKKTKALKPGIDYGPLIAPFQIEIINDHLKDATNKGAKILTGGKSDGNWFEPTVLIGVNHSMKIMKEESFGPLLPIMSFSSEKEAIELCNDCQLGLNAVIFTKDKKRAERELAPKIEAGVVTINEAMINYLVIGAPQGGVKLSGWGPHRHGREGIQRFCDQKTILIHSFSWPFLNRREIWWFPYTNLTKKAYQLFVKILKFG